MRSTSRHFALVLALAGAAIARPAAAAPYKIVQFDPPAAFGNEESYYGVNDFGTVVGNYATPVNQSTDGLVYQYYDNTFTDVLGPSAGPDNGNLRASVQGLNNLGVSVGGYLDPQGNTHGFVRDASGAVTALPDPAGATLTVAFGINDFGLIAGRTADAAGVTRGFLYDGNGYETFAYPGSSETFFTGINDYGRVVGRYRDAAGNFHSFLLNAYTLKVLKSLDYPGAVSTFAEAINNRGQIVGDYLGTDGIEHGLLRQPDGQTLVLDVPGMLETDIYGINDFGVAVGTDLDANFNNYGLVFLPN